MVRSPIVLTGWLLWLTVFMVGCGNPSASHSPVPEGRPADPPPVAPLVGGATGEATAIDPGLATEVDQPALLLDPVAPTNVTAVATDASSELPTPLPIQAASPSSTPGTVRQAADLLDFRTFPLLPGTEEVPPRSIAQASYQAPGRVEAAFRFLREHLETRDWKELAGGYVTEQAATGTFVREGFKVSVSVIASSSEGEGKVRATLIHHGNVATDRLPLPPNSTPLYQTPVSSASLTELPVEEAREKIVQLLLEQGWSSYGEAGDTQSFRQNAVKLLVRVTSAPAQGGKTLVDYSSQLMSAEIPLPPGATQVHYSDAPTQLAFDTQDDYEFVANFYVESLAEVNWKPTTERLVTIDRKDFLIFRNPDKDLLEVELTRVADMTRVLVRHQTAEEVLAEERRLEEERLRREALANQPKPRVRLKLPAGARDVEETETRVEFTVSVGEGRQIVEWLQSQLADDQWEVESATLEPMIGSVVLKKEDQRVTLAYVETGILRPDIAVTVRGAELELADGDRDDGDENGD